MEIIISKKQRIINGKPTTVTITRHIGRAIYEDNGRIVEADEFHEIDCGLGVTKVYVHYPNGESALQDLMSTCRRVLNG